MCVPSLLAHVFGVFVLMLAFVLFIVNFKKISSGDPYKLIVLALLFSAVITIHGISHLGLESTYGYNPLVLFKKYQ